MSEIQHGAAARKGETSAPSCPTCGHARAPTDPHLIDGRPMRDVSGNIVTEQEHSDVMQIVEVLMAIPEDRRLTAFARAFDGYLKTDGFTCTPQERAERQARWTPVKP